MVPRRLIWPTGLGFLANFIFGCLTVVSPTMHVKTAGFALSSLFLSRLLGFIPAGIVTDRFGYRVTLMAFFGLQVLALSLILWSPTLIWAGRACEGLAMAMLMVAIIGATRIAVTDEAAFEATIQRVLSTASMGYIFGPIFGLMLGTNQPSLVLIILLGTTVGLGLMHWFVVPAIPMPTAPMGPSDQNTSSVPLSRKVWWALTMGFGAAKALLQSWQILIAWWSTAILQFSAGLSGFGFLLLGLLFGVGSRFARRPILSLGFLSFVFIELAMRIDPLFWWIGVAGMGFWYGQYASYAAGKLGWCDPSDVGRKASNWLLISDIPVIAFPMMIWAFRAPDDIVYRMALFCAVFAVCAYGVFVEREIKSEKFV